MILTVLTYVCIIYCIGAVLTFLSYGFISGAFKDGIWGLIFSAAFAFFWIYTIPAVLYDDHQRQERRKERGRKRNSRN